MGFNSGFKGLIKRFLSIESSGETLRTQHESSRCTRSGEFRQLGTYKLLTK